MKAYVAVTDGDWYRFLVDRPGLTEANFWLPGGGILSDYRRLPVTTIR